VHRIAKGTPYHVSHLLSNQIRRITSELRDEIRKLNPTSKKSERTAPSEPIDLPEFLPRTVGGQSPHFGVDQSRRRRVKSLEQLISASWPSSCPKDPRNWLTAITDHHDPPPGGRCRTVRYLDRHAARS
jgi:hypothetical protein